MAAVVTLPHNGLATPFDSNTLSISPPPPVSIPPSTSLPSQSPPPVLPPSPPATPPSPTATPSSSFPATRRAPAFDDCCVCFNGDSDESDPIVFCDGPSCTAVVHQSCYGVAVVPEGDWLCDSCAVKAQPSLASHPSLLLSFNRCLLCPHVDGAFKPLATGEGWVHAACAIWVPETGFRDAEKVDAVIGVDTIDRNRWRLICDVCGERKGCCVQCVGSACRWSCHVLCGWKAGYRMEMQVIGSTDEDLDVLKLVYCDRHREDRWDKRDRRYRGRAVRLNDAATALALSQEHSHDSTPRRPRQRREVDPAREGGYRCVRCGSRTRQHECSRRGEDDEEERLEMEEEQEPEDEELKALYLHSLSLLTEAEKRQREEEETQEAAYWELVQEDIDKEREDKRTADRERRTLEAERMEEESALYLELKHAQEREEEAFIMGEEGGTTQPPSTSRKRRRRKDESWREESESSSMPRERRVGRPKGSRTRVRRCLVHRTPPPCPLSCPSRPPPWTDEELKLKAARPRARDRRRRREEEKMNTTAPGQRKALQAATLASVLPSPATAAPVTPARSSSFLASVPLPLPVHPPIPVPPPSCPPPPLLVPIPRRHPR